MHSTTHLATARVPSATVHSLPVPARLRTAGPAAASASALDHDDPASAPLACRRLLLALLFTDIVGSTRLVERLGDRAWHDVLARQRAIQRAQLALVGGVEVDCLGDGLFAVFGAPAIAIACAASIGRALSGLGISIRAGVHAGECDFETGGRVSGIAVHVAARLAALAQPGEILVSETVKDLVAGSGIGLADRGRRTLRGLSGRRRLFALQEPVCECSAPAPASRPKPSA